MTDQDYTEEYYRRLSRLSDALADLREEVQAEIARPLRAEDYPDPTRSQMAWDEDTQSKVRVRTEVDSHAIDRGEG